MTRPISLSIGVILQWLAALVSAIAGFDLVAAAFSMSRDGVGRRIEEALVLEGITDIAGSLVVLGVFIAGVLIVTLALTRILVASYVWQGRSWARIVLTVLIGINIVSGVAYLFDGYFMRALLTVPIDIVALFLIFNSQSSAFIKERTAARQKDVADAV